MVDWKNSITQQTKTVREREPSSLPMFKLYSLFRQRFTPERILQYSRANFSAAKNQQQTSGDRS